MHQLPGSITLSVVILTVFLIFITALKYAVEDTFVRTRITMTAFFFFIVATLSVAFWHYAFATLPYTAPAALLGIALGYVLGVRTEQQKLRVQGIEHYMEHFAHVHLSDLTALSWWSVINFYSVMGGLLLINLVGFTNVILQGSEAWAIATSTVGAFLLGTIVPYLIHLWTLPAGRRASSQPM